MRIGDKFFVDLQPGLTAGGGRGRYEEVTKITTQYDKNTGEKYSVIWFGDHGFDSRSGFPTNTPWGYCINMEGKPETTTDECVELNFLDSIKRTLEDTIAFRPIRASIGELKNTLEYINCKITNIELEEERETDESTT